MPEEKEERQPLTSERLLDLLERADHDGLAKLFDEEEIADIADAALDLEIKDILRLFALGESNDMGEFFIALPDRTKRELLENIIQNRNQKLLKKIFDEVPNIDIAEAADDLEPRDLIYIFHTIESHFTADFFDDLSQDTKEALIKAMTDRDLVQLINAQAADDMADAVGDMPANLASKVLRAADKEMRKDINALLKYKESTAGSIMTTEYLEFIDSMKVDEAIEQIRERGKEAETVYTIFVRNKQREFVGTVDLDDLIFAQKDQTLNEIMNKDVVYVYTFTDQEEVGQMFRRYDLNALAVLNDDDRLVGIITIDDAVDVMTEESSEDFARLAKMEPTEQSYLDSSPWNIAKKCIPWIIALLILGTFTTLVLNRLESQTIFVNLPILIAFVPMLMDAGGNAGGQTTGIMIRGLSLQEFGPKDILRVLWKEVRSASLVGLFVTTFAFAWVLIEQYTGIVDLGVVGGTTDLSGLTIWNGGCWTEVFAENAFRNAALISLTLFCAIFLAKMVGALLPLGAAAIKKDPALLSQPMLTTIMDVLSLILYFLMACLFFPNLR